MDLLSYLSVTLVGDILSLGLTCLKADPSTSPEPELERLRGLSSDSVSECVASSASSLMLDRVEAELGVGGEVRGCPAPSTDRARRLCGELRPKGRRGRTAPAAASSGGRNRLPRGEGSFSCRGRLSTPAPGRPALEMVSVKILPSI